LVRGKQKDRSGGNFTRSRRTGSGRNEDQHEMRRFLQHYTCGARKTARQSPHLAIADVMLSVLPGCVLIPGVLDCSVKPGNDSYCVIANTCRGLGSRVAPPYAHGSDGPKRRCRSAITRRTTVQKLVRVVGIPWPFDRSRRPFARHLGLELRKHEIASAGKHGEWQIPEKNRHSRLLSRCVGP
jgi:hypothetical protein